MNVAVKSARVLKNSGKARKMAARDVSMARAKINSAMTSNPNLEWQRRYEENDMPWDKGIAAPPLTQYLSAHPIAGRVLVPGCGLGHDVRALAAQTGCTVVGLDLAAAAVTGGSRLTAEAGLTASASFVLGDFFKLDPAMAGAFDWLVEHTCFCAIEPSQRPDYVRSAATALRPGGKIFGIFYLTPDVEDGPPFRISQEELFAFFAANFDVLEHWVPTVSFPGRENRELVAILQKR
jgi:SAM-dependent methyltransferase